MNAYQLLLPRYICIALFPQKNFCEPKAQPIQIGDIFMQLIPQETCWRKTIGFEKWTDDTVHFIEQYPAIFRKMEWPEQRTLEEMPSHIKFVADYMDYKAGEVYRVEDWGDQFSRGNIPFRTKDTEFGLSAVPFRGQIFPASEEEFINYQNKI